MGDIYLFKMLIPLIEMQVFPFNRKIKAKNIQLKDSFLNSIE